MARENVKLLDTGDKFPDLQIKLTSGETTKATDAGKLNWKVILFYRGNWCPFCIAQLKSFQIGLDKLAAEDIGVVAISVDSLEQALETKEQTGAAFPIAYGIDFKEVAEKTGAFYDLNRPTVAPYVHSTGFVIDPQDNVVISVYSSGAIGRLAWQDVLGLVKYLKSKSQ